MTSLSDILRQPHTSLSSLHCSGNGARAVLACTLLNLLLAAPASADIAAAYPGASKGSQPGTVLSGTVLNNTVAAPAQPAPAVAASPEPNSTGTPGFLSRFFSSGGDSGNPAAQPAAAPADTHAMAMELGEPDSSPALFAARQELDIPVPPRASSAPLPLASNTATTAGQAEPHPALGEPDNSPELFGARRELSPVQNPNKLTSMLGALMKPLSGEEETPSADAPQAAPASYESPGIVIKKETLRQTELQPNLTPSEIKMASLNPASGESANGSGPLIQLPDVPPPVIPAQNEPSVTPTTLVKPVTTTPVITKAPAPSTAESSEPRRELSPASKNILNKIPANLGTASSKPKGPIAVDRVAAQDKPAENMTATSSVQHEKMGIKIEVKAPKLDMNYELEKAYNAMVAGQTETAMGIYKNILDNDPNNKSALFGLGTLYHRAGQIESARKLYSKLLSIDPTNRDGLNNFLVLMSDEAPEAALEQLSKLEKRDPKFSPIPAQMAIIYQKMGDLDKASEKMFKAVDLSPENLVYRYNLAIMLDKQQKYDEAGKLYYQIIQAYQRGESIPGNIQQIQQRLTFISSNKP